VGTSKKVQGSTGPDNGSKPKNRRECKMNRKPKLLTTALLALVFFIAACDEDDNDGTGPTPPIANSVSLRAVHASPDAPAVDVYANDGTTPLVQDLAYGEATSYVDIPEGT
jgi:hypothetical protein